MANAGLRRFAVLVVFCTFALLVSGSLVTSNDAALSVPDWPLSWGRLVPPLEGGIRYEFTHRVLVAAVALLISLQAFWTNAREHRPWMRRLAWAALLAVLAQAALGGALVKLVDPKLLAISHACLAQLCFGLTVAIAAGHYPAAGAGKSTVPVLAAAGLFVQTILGAAVRHHALSPTPHIAGAVVATAVVMWACMAIVMKHLDEPALRRPAMLLLMLTAAQIFLGLAAYTVLEMAVDDPQPMPLTVWTTVAHVVVGALAFGAAIRLVLAGDR